jgi:hypothetical protein
MVATTVRQATAAVMVAAIAEALLTARPAPEVPVILRVEAVMRAAEVTIKSADLPARL